MGEKKEYKIGVPIYETEIYSEESRSWPRPRRMTRKRFIKLLMGKFHFSRNRARYIAKKMLLWQEIGTTNNVTLKKLGDKTREMPPSYSDFWLSYHIPGGKKGVD